MEARTILIADDNQSDVLLLQRLFRQARILNPVQVVQDGEDAICYLKGEGRYTDRARFPFPVLLLLDLKMPKPGTKVLAWLNQNPSIRPLAAVVMTDGSNVAEIQEAYNLGAHSFLMKPLNQEDFLNLTRGLKGIKLTSAPEGHVLDFSDGGESPT